MFTFSMFGFIYAVLGVVLIQLIFSIPLAPATPPKVQAAAANQKGRWYGLKKKLGKRFEL